MSRIERLAQEPYYVLGRYLRKNHPRIMSDEYYIKVVWKQCMGYELDLDNPKTFNEKLQWLKLHDRNPLYTTLVDKYEVKKWVAQRIGKEHVIPVLAVYDSVDEIDMDALPAQFVLKCNHDCGSIVICKDKAAFDLQSAKEKLDKALKKNYYWETREWPYKGVRPRIIAEEYKEDYSGELRDYKVYAFNGKCDYLMLCVGRSEGETRFLYYDRSWNMHKELSYDGLNYGDSINVEKPANLDSIFTFAQLLSVGIPFVRVDFYESFGELFFGEMTLYPSAGFGGNRTPDLDRYLNEQLVLNGFNK